MQLNNKNEYLERVWNDPSLKLVTIPSDNNFIQHSLKNWYFPEALLTANHGLDKDLHISASELHPHFPEIENEHSLNRMMGHSTRNFWNSIQINIEKEQPKKQENDDDEEYKDPIHLGQKNTSDPG